MIYKILSFFSSMKFVALLLLIFAFSIGYATFIENDFGSSSARALIYNSWWFEMILIILTACLIYNIYKFKLIRKEKLSILIFHLSFIIILIGAGVTRYFGYEGMMQIYENETKNIFLSDDAFVQINIHDKSNQYKLDKKVYFSGITKRFDKTPILQSLFSNYFYISNSDLKNKFSIEYIDFIPNAEDSILKKEIVGLRLNSSGVSEKEGTQISIEEMIHKNLIINDSIRFKSTNFTLNQPQQDAVNFYIKDGKLQCVSSFKTYTSSMPPNGELPVSHNANDTFIVKPMTLLEINNIKYMLSDFLYDGEKTYYSKSLNMDDSENNKHRTIDALKLKIKVNDKNKDVILFGKKGRYSEPNYFQIDSLYFALSYGSKYYTTPFSLGLNNAIVERYPGTNSASSYASEIIVKDINKDTTFPFRIFMNNILNYRGYRFYQSSIDNENEQWTGLSVNHDKTGSLITYIGYSLLILGIILVFFSKHTRMHQLSNNLNKLKLIIILCISFSFNSYSTNNISYIDSVNKYKISIDHAKSFESVLMQHNGRIKPTSTFSSEIIRKISRKQELHGLNSTQILLGIMSNPELWRHIPIIKVKNQDLLKKLNTKDNLLPFTKFINENGEYILDAEIQEANSVSDSRKSKLHKAVIQVTERFNILYSILMTSQINTNFNIFPNIKSTNQTWEGTLDVSHVDSNLHNVELLNMYLFSLRSSCSNNDWTLSDKLLDIIKKYQNENAGHILPKKYKVNLEIAYNKLNIFYNLFIYYFIVGLFLLVILLFDIFYQSRSLNKIIKTLIVLVILGFIVHILGLAMRWIISGHAPWSNGYESMIYISFVTVLAGFIFLKRSPISLSATTLTSSILLMVAHLNWLDPTITNLVPVLNSYWLMIHVSIITSSYGFFSLGALLGFIVLWLIIFTTNHNKSKLKSKIQELTIINEKTITIGLFMLTIGTFLGGVWANESWGRYWGWDPKETWALVSILVYAFILHMRFVPPLKGVYMFNLMSLIAISSIIMTYFGVNYYLSGLHSYAAGDPMPIPTWIYIFIIIMFITGFLAKTRYNKNFKK